MKEPKAIIVGDIHLSDNPPICRQDDWWDAMERNLKFLQDLEEEFSPKTDMGFVRNPIPTLCPGDLFHEPYKNHNRPSHKLINFAANNLPVNFITTVGNHDVPAHNMDKLSESGLYSMAAMGRIILVYGAVPYLQNNLYVKGYHFKQELSEITPNPESKNTTVALAHHYCYLEEKPFPTAPDEGTAAKVASKLSGFDLIVVGDNHQNFSLHTPTRTLLNPGSLMRLTASQKDFQPMVYVWFGGEDFEEIPVPVSRDIISEKHLEEKREADVRVDVFMDSVVNDDYDLDLNYKKNLDAYFQVHSTPSDIVDKIRNAMVVK